MKQIHVELHFCEILQDFSDPCVDPTTSFPYPQEPCNINIIFHLTGPVHAGLWYIICMCFLCTVLERVLFVLGIGMTS